MFCINIGSSAVYTIWCSVCVCVFFAFSNYITPIFQYYSSMWICMMNENMLKSTWNWIKWDKDKIWRKHQQKLVSHKRKKQNNYCQFKLKIFVMDFSSFIFFHFNFKHNHTFCVWKFLSGDSFSFHRIYTYNFIYISTIKLYARICFYIESIIIAL